MVSPPLTAVVTAFLVLTASCCLLRLFALNLFSTYPAFTFFLFSQLATTIFSSFADVTTNTYAYAYLILLVVEWLAYGFMIRELHTAIFSQYPGIAIFGRWSIYAALAATIFIVLIEWAFASPNFPKRGSLIFAVEFASHCLTFGFAALLIIILIVVSKYPLAMHKNIVVNGAFFSVILLGETAELLFDQISMRQYTGNLNLAMGFVGGLCFSFWTILLSREGQTQILEWRRAYSAGDEARLLDQLSAVNTLLLRAARK